MLQWPNLHPDSDEHSCVRPRGSRKPTAASQPKARPAVTALRFLVTAGAAILISAISIVSFPTQPAAQTAAAVPYENMPEIAPPGVRVDKHIDVPDSAKGPAVDPAKGYRLQRLVPRSRRPVGAHTPTELGFAAALQAMSARLEK